ncbi:MAG: hypothetical protein A2007_04860 [Verrucomicrobia bacterium GWC2_42_7]|nr:MAG: hypothetical protein A2007_04860 [Verrucomicrobia bacterium GWC2_42_7]
MDSVLKKYITFYSMYLLGCFSVHAEQSVSADTIYRIYETCGRSCSCCRHPGDECTCGNFDSCFGSSSYIYFGLPDERQEQQRQKLLAFGTEGSKKYRYKADRYTVSQLLGSDDIVARIIGYLLAIEKSDLDSMIEGRWTDNALRFKELIENLQRDLLYSPIGGLSFWSGYDARKYMENRERPLARTDLMTPVFCFLFATSRVIQQYEGINVYMAQLATCAILATQASGVVNVYISSDKKSEPVGMKSGNYFWEIELPILQKLKQGGQVSAIMLNLLDSNTDRWSAPIEWNSEQSNSLPVYRQKPYILVGDSYAQGMHSPLAKPEDKTLFDENDFYRQQYGSTANREVTMEIWQKSCRARPHLSLGQLRTMIKKWKDYKKQRPL